MPPEILNVELGARSYPILIGRHWFGQLGKAVQERTTCERVLVVSDSRVNKLYGEAVTAALAQAGLTVESVVFAEGESSKTIETCMTIWSFLLANNYTRETVVVALGGGVVGDVAGFAAAAYMRGVPYVQAPTSLLAMVDSSVGGKTAVNHPLGKNMIGAFHQPLFVFTDLECLSTLDPVEFRAGFAEVVKYGVIRDADLFAFCEQQREAILALDTDALQRIVKTCCAIKADVVSADEREGGLRAILNFGHTLGHAIESLTKYSLLKHGEAVAIGMVAAGRLAVAMGRFERSDQDRIERLLESVGLPVRIPARLEAEDLIERMRKDKKVRHGRIRLVLPEAIGRVTVESDYPHSLLLEVLEGMRS
ncbi:3-dehydroquinate synthase [Candidatus Sumerlaeota bacterium]|nr:3-dehydroquinate synthase [Candidatus Sumerlaeota bacterium]